MVFHHFGVLNFIKNDVFFLNIAYTTNGFLTIPYLKQLKTLKKLKKLKKHTPGQRLGWLAAVCLSVCLSVCLTHTHTHKPYTHKPHTRRPRPRPPRPPRPPQRQLRARRHSCRGCTRASWWERASNSRPQPFSPRPRAPCTLRLAPLQVDAFLAHAEGEAAAVQAQNETMLRQLHCRQSEGDSIWLGRVLCPPPRGHPGGC